MTEASLEVCILAAGMGTRMRSPVPKVLQLLAGKPLLAHLIETVEKLQPARIHIIVGPEGSAARERLANTDVNWVTQHERRGTGHAVQQAIPHVDSQSRLLILVGDAPLISLGTLQALVAERAPLTLLSVQMDDPGGYGRIVRGESDLVKAIVEHVDATEDQLRINEINTGVMIAEAARLAEWLPQLSADNVQKELLLTDIVGIANRENAAVRAVVTDDAVEVTGVNSLNQLAELERELQHRYASALLAQGVHIIDPSRFSLRGELSCGSGVRIDVNSIFEGEVALGDGVQVGSNCYIRDAVIEANSIIRPNSVLEECHVGVENQVGPFARLRPGTVLGSSVTIGNFVEVKNSTVGTGSKASHLTYLGDAVLGSNVNVGAGTITCNYDGVDKHETRIEDNVFVGSNAAIVAPVTIGEGSTIAAGSTITKDVARGVLALGRSRQTSIDNWKRQE